MSDQWPRRYGPAKREHRNRDMNQAGADLCIAVRGDLGLSVGTKDRVRQAIAAGIPMYLIASTAGAPEWLEADDGRRR